MSSKHLLAISFLGIFFAWSCEKDDPDNSIANLPESDCVDQCLNGGTAIPSTSSEPEFCECECIEPYFGPLCTEIGSTATGFDCISGNCQTSSNGTYQSQSDCESNCGGGSENCISANGPSFTDPRDGNVYQTVIIGSQIWMAENLRYMPSVSYGQDGSVSSPHYYKYGLYSPVFESESESNYNTYGTLYNWPAVMAGAASSASFPSNVQGVCPDGWHLPSALEWQALIDCSGGVYEAGGNLKESGTSHWESPNTGATNETGFTALPSGRRGHGTASTFGSIGVAGHWWTATEESGVPISFGLSHQMEAAGMGPNNFDYAKAFGYACRCVMD